MLDCMRARDDPPRSLCLRTGSAPALSGEAPAWVVEIAAAHADSETGLAAFWTDDEAWVALPPFPIEGDLPPADFEPSPLLDAISREVVVGVILIRMGRYAVGVLRGNRLIASKTDTRHVKNRHRAGGSSQRRFMRSRERLIRELYDETCGVARRVFEPHAAALTRVLMGGERHTVNGFLKRCEYLQTTGVPVMSRLLAVERPNHAALESIHREVWKSQVFAYRRTL